MPFRKNDNIGSKVKKLAHYSIQVLEIGYDEHFPLGVAFDFWHMNGQQAYSPFAMTIIRGEGHNILFDCGIDTSSDYSAAKIKMENDQNCHNTEDVLRAAGIDPADIDAVVLSHCHWDHMGGIKYLPNATFYIQKKEVDSWESALANPLFPITHKMVVNPEDLAILHSCRRVVYLDGDEDELFPGISVKVAYGHSFAQNMLYINNDGEHFAIIGDVAMRPESFKGTEEFPCILPNLRFAVGTISDVTLSYKSIMDWVSNDVSHIIPTHDGTRQDIWPTVRGKNGLNVTTVC